MKRINFRPIGVCSRCLHIVDVTVKDKNFTYGHVIHRIVSRQCGLDNFTITAPHTSTCDSWTKREDKRCKKS